jgi:hypothetical protein
MLTLLIWWVAILMESLLLFRGLRGKLVSKYPFFYTYIASVLISDVGLFFVYTGPYAKWRLLSTLVILVLGYGIILEIFTHVLAPYPGAERFARITGLIVFGLVFSFALIYPFVTPETLQGSSTVELVRNFRMVQAIFLFTIFGVVSYYRIPLGRNLKGMIFGYGLCLGVSLMALALRSYLGLRFDAAWVIVQPFSFDVSLFVWVATLWSYHPNPTADPAIGVEADYDMFAERTKGTIGAMRSHIGKAARP